MRVVIDTGVLISAAIKSQTTPSLTVHRVAQQDVMLKSDLTEAELRDVISRPYLARLIAPAARDWLMQLMADAEQVSVSGRIQACRDPKDDKFLDVAVYGGADLIIRIPPRRDRRRGSCGRRVQTSRLFGSCLFHSGIQRGLFKHILDHRSALPPRLAAPSQLEVGACEG